MLKSLNFRLTTDVPSKSLSALAWWAAAFPLQLQSPSSKRDYERQGWSTSSSQGSRFIWVRRFCKPLLARFWTQVLFPFPRNAIPARRTQRSKQADCLKVGMRAYIAWSRRTETLAGSKRMASTVTDTRTASALTLNMDLFAGMQWYWPLSLTARCFGEC